MIDNHSKHCARCDSVRLLSEFGSNKARKDGVSVYCCVCTKSYMSTKTYDADRWRDHREQESARSAAYRAANRDRLEIYWREKSGRARIDSPGQIRAWNIARKHGEIRATPRWANLQAIGAFYIEAKRLAALDGKPRHVDHIIPLKHPLVCGLHVESNLQILTAVDNMVKHNKFNI